MICDKFISHLPIWEVIPRVVRALRDGSRAVLSSPPGSGKTTVVPLALLQEKWLASRRILLLEPRRLAARMAAARMATLLGEEIGETVGYRIRFERRVSERTRIEVVTEGVLTRLIQRDPDLAGTGLVIFDEFHERSIHADLAMALCLDIMEGLRPDLRMLVMSATIDAASVSTFLKNAPVTEGQGQVHPVTIHYLEGKHPHQLSGSAPGAREIGADTAAGVLRALREQQGDILAFLPGEREIRAAASALSSLPGKEHVVHPLYGNLTKALQDRAISPDPAGRRRIVLATAIAETSLTIEDVTTVVDSGWSRVSRFDPNTALTRLVTVRVARSAAAQRAGRAGRLGPGACYRLWPRTANSLLREKETPEILSADLAPLALELALWGAGSPDDLHWLDPPPAGAYAQARELLCLLDALDKKGRITEQGKKMAEISVHPRLAHMLLMAGKMDCVPLACDLAALLGERDIISSAPWRPTTVDMELRLHILDRYREKGHAVLSAFGVAPDTCARVMRLASEIRRFMGAAPWRGKGIGKAALLLSHAYPDRIAGKRRDAAHRYLLASGRGAALSAGDQLAGKDFLVAAEIDAGKKEGFIFRAAELSIGEIREGHAGQIITEDSISWDERNNSVAAAREERIGSVILSSTALSAPDPELIRKAMIAGIRATGIEALPWTGEARRLQSRVESLRRWRPDLPLPPMDDAYLLSNLKKWLDPYLDGMTRLDHLKRLDLVQILHGLLAWEGRRLIDEGAPPHITAPSGSRSRLRYAPGEPPVLPVRLQEMFGLGETPTVCWGQVRIVLHLLSPAMRPIQVTTDLRGFWENTYAVVKKELQGRYPRHHWPDDPWKAAPTARTKRRTPKNPG